MCDSPEAAQVKMGSMNRGAGIGGRDAERQKHGGRDGAIRHAQRTIDELRQKTDARDQQQIVHEGYRARDPLSRDALISKTHCARS
jgi:hypothetical protein